MNTYLVSRDSGFLFGIGAGIWSAGSSQYAYLVGYEQITTQSFVLLGADLIAFGLLLFLALRHRQRFQEGLLRFSDAVATGMKYFFLAGLITVIVNYFTFNVIQPDYAMTYAEKATTSSVEELQKLLREKTFEDDQSQTQIKNQIQNLREHAFYGGRKVFVHMTLWIGLGLLASLFMGALMRTDRGRRNRENSSQMPE